MQSTWLFTPSSQDIHAPTLQLQTPTDKTQQLKPITPACNIETKSQDMTTQSGDKLLKYICSEIKMQTLSDDTTAANIKIKRNKKKKGILAE
jgi:hypothetical protein